MELEKPFLDPWFKVKADGAHVADNLILRLFQGKIETSFAPLAGRLGKDCPQTALPRSRRPGYQNAAAPVIPLPSHHHIQAGNPGGYPFAGNLVVQLEGGYGKDGNAFFINQERVFIGAVGGSPVFYDS